VLKFLGAVMIIAATTGMGFSGREFLRQRQNVLRQFAFALANLKTGISYGLLPLPQLLAGCLKQENGDVARFLTNVATEIEQGSGNSFGDIWQRQMQGVGRTLALKAEDKDILLQFAAGLGASDKNDQLARLELTCARLKAQEEAAGEELLRLGKLCSALGVSFGVVLVLLCI